MCGRFSLAVDKETFESTMQSAFDLDVDYDAYALPRYNIAPSQDIPALIHDGKSYRLGSLNWGFKPAFIEDSTFKVVNVRSETVASKPLFQSSFELRRCLIIADGFFEWKNLDGKKTPMRFVHTKAPLFTMAGIYTRSVDKDGSPYYSVAILTQAANDDMANVHDRMPVLIKDEERLNWVHPSNNKDLAVLKNLLQKKPPGLLKHFPVSSAVNTPKNDIPECLIPMHGS